MTNLIQQQEDNPIKTCAEDLDKHSADDDIQMANRYMKRFLTLLIIRKL